MFAECKREMRRLDVEVADGERQHRLCLDRIDALTEHAIPRASLQRGLLWFDGDEVRPAQFLTVQLSRLSSSYGDFAVVPAYRPRPVTFVMVSCKPYVRLAAFDELSSADWRDHFPPFHYTVDSSGNLSVCVGNRFRIGDATSPAENVKAVAELLSWVYLGGAYRQLPDIIEQHPSGPWQAWADALSAIAKGLPQAVFTPLLRS